MKYKLFFLSTILFSATFSNAQMKTGLHVINTFKIASAGGWDYLELGPVNDWLYVSHGTQVNILNKKTGDSVGVIENTTAIAGVAFAVGYIKGNSMNASCIFDYAYGVTCFFIQYIYLCAMTNIKPVINRAYFQIIPATWAGNFKSVYHMQARFHLCVGKSC